MGFFVLAIPVAAVMLFLLVKGRRAQHAISVAASLLQAVVAVFLTREVMRAGSIAYSALGGLFYIDSLSIIVLDIVIVIGLMTSLYSIGYMEEEIRHGKMASGKLRFYYVLMYSFIFTMVLSLTVRNMGIMWIAIEATTLASAFLVGFYNDKNALEAAWKYILICSVGIAIAMLGIILLHLSSTGVLEDSRFLDFTALFEQAKSLKSPTVRLAFIFILVGFGTKAGLAPMHTWLPDAHSQAPSPISALLSGVLLNSAMYGIIRTVSIVNRNLGSSVFTGRLLIAMGILSVTVAAVFILTQKDYKRLLAYSSIEHMGIVAIAVGVFSPVAVFGAILHMINHSLTKSMLFLSSGSILQKYDTKIIYRIKGVLRVLPVTGFVFLLGLFAIAGTPPFSVFASELSVITAVFQSRRFLLGAALAILLAVIFGGIAATMFKMFYGKADENRMPGETNVLGAVSTLVLLIVIALTGLIIPVGLRDLIGQAQRIITGG
jgi:hydrogenase-4 component F